MAESFDDPHLETLQRSANLLLGTSVAPVGALQRPGKIFKLGQEVKLPTRQGLSAFKIYRPVSQTSIAAVWSPSEDKYSAAAALPRSDIHRSRGMLQGDRLKQAVALAPGSELGVYAPLLRLLGGPCRQKVKGLVWLGGQVVRWWANFWVLQTTSRVPGT